MLDVLHEDSNKVKKKPYVEALEDDWVKNNNLERVRRGSLAKVRLFVLQCRNKAMFDSHRVAACV